MPPCNESIYRRSLGVRPAHDMCEPGLEAYPGGADRLGRARLGARDAARRRNACSRDLTCALSGLGCERR